MAELEAVRRRVQGRDGEALAEYIRLLQPQLLAYITRQMGDALRRRFEPTDILQETAIASLNALSKTDLTDRDPFGWLCQIAQQRIIDASRRIHAQKRGASHELALDAPAPGGEHDWISILAASVTSPSQACVRSERDSKLHEAIRHLPAEVQQLLRWRYVDGMPTKDIAARTGKSDGAIRVLISRTVQKLQELLRDESS